MPLDAGDFRLLSRRAADVLVRLRERHRFMRGMARWSGFDRPAVPYDRAPRHAGRTKYGFGHMLRLAADALFAFSRLPLRVATILGSAIAILSIGYAAWVFVMRITAEQPVSGWASLIVAVLFLGSAQLVCMGIIGEYIGRIHDEVRARPLYVLGDVARHPDAHLPAPKRVVHPPG